MGDWITSFLLMGALSTGGTLPFWASANQFGLAPESNGVLAAGFTISLRCFFGFSCGWNGAGFATMQ